MESRPLTDGYEVLVVEDEMRVRDMLARALREMGFRSTVMPTAQAAMKVLTQKNFDIVILDLNLPGMDGMEFLQSIRSRKHDVEVIILTGFGGLDAAKTAIRLDVVDFITKPYALQDLEIALDRARKRIRDRILLGQPIVESGEDKKPTPPAEEPPRASAWAHSEDLEEVERQQILHVLEKHQGNRSRAAAELGISLRKLYYRIGEYQRKGLIHE